MGLLGDLEIRQCLENGNIVIDPFDESQLGTNSYDVRLGEWYFKPSKNTSRFHDVIDFTEPDDVARFWGEPIKAESGRFTIEPYSTYLCHTIEIIGGKMINDDVERGITSEMRARSSFGRSCLSVAKCAGMGDVGYVNRWTMEVTNFSHVHIPLYVGMRVAQILFHDVYGVGRSYQGNYGQGLWSPQDMLPKLTRS